MPRRSRDERAKIEGRLGQGKRVSAVYTPKGSDRVHELTLRPPRDGLGYALTVGIYREGDFYAEDNWLVNETWHFQSLDGVFEFMARRFGLDYRRVRFRAG